MDERGQISNGATWYEASAVERPDRGPLKGAFDVDVCVIGAGLAGLTVAHELARRGWQVAVLETGRIGSAASGRNTGLVIPGFNADVDAIVRRVGPEHAKSLWDLSEAGVEYVRRTIRENKMTAATLTEGGWLNVSKTGNERALQAEAKRLAKEFGAAVDYWPPERVRTALRSDLYFGAVHYKRAFAIHPLNYARGLATLAEAAGARIFEETPAIGLDPVGVRKRVMTPAGRVRAEVVVFAASVGVTPLMQEIGWSLVPAWRYVIVTAPIGPELREAISYRGSVSDTRRGHNQYRVVGGDRLMWSGRFTTKPESAARAAPKLIADIVRAYPQLRGIKAEFAWTGVLGSPSHQMPQIGEISPGLWVTSGFGGHGLNTTAMAGELIARGIAEGDSAWRLFTPFELVSAGGMLGRASVQAYTWAFQARERVAGWKAQALRRLRKEPDVAEAQPETSVAPPDPPAPPEEPAVTSAASAAAKPWPTRLRKTKPPAKRRTASAQAKSKKPSVPEFAGGDAPPAAEASAAPVAEVSLVSVTEMSAAPIAEVSVASVDEVSAVAVVEVSAAPVDEVSAAPVAEVSAPPIVEADTAPAPSAPLADEASTVSAVEAIFLAAVEADAAEVVEAGAPPIVEADPSATLNATPAAEADPLPMPDAPLAAEADAPPTPVEAPVVVADAAPAVEPSAPATIDASASPIVEDSGSPSIDADGTRAPETASAKSGSEPRGAASQG